MLPSSPKKGYAAIDCGNGRKLEAVGPYVLDRPESRAQGEPALSRKEWEERTHAVYMEDPKGKMGEWKRSGKVPEEWEVELRTEQLSMELVCERKHSKHFGFFPEQAINWDLLYERIGRMKGTQGAPRALLLFAYTGAASMACRMAGADTFHVEASKRYVTRAKENMKANGLRDIRWVLEDAMKFVQREERRGKEYRAIVLDFPSFGRGPGGEVWKAEDMAAELLERSNSLLAPEEHLLIGNLYSERVPIDELERSLRQKQKGKGADRNIELEELYIPSGIGNRIPGGRRIKVEAPAASNEKD